MGGRDPDQIWDESVVEGNRRLSRGTIGLAATGLVGGVDVMFGILALTVVSGALAVAVPEQIAHVTGSLVFGIGFVLLIVGRGELFTENFLVPVSAVLAGRAPSSALLRLWGVTFVANYVGILLLAAMMQKTGVLRPETLEAGRRPADTLVGRGAGAALLSGVLAGAVMTLMTWLTHAAEQDITRIAIALLCGFVIALGTMNHAVVSFGETILAYLAGTTDASLGEIAGTLVLAVAGNLIGGLGLVTVNRLIQARGEPD